jgi:hypothetical protein
MADNNELFLAKLDALKELFEDATKGVILCENSINKTLEGPNNEMRSALYHIMDMVGSRHNQNTCEHEFDGAKSHILRAGYDAYEIICMHYIEDIKTMLGDFAPSDISAGFAEYYNTIKPEIQKIEEYTARIRETKAKERQKVDESKAYGEAEISKEQTGYKYYLEATNKLKRFVEATEKHICSINDVYRGRTESDRKNDKRNRKSILIGLLGTILGAIIGAFLSYIFSK